MAEPKSARKSRNAAFIPASPGSSLLARSFLIVPTGGFRWVHRLRSHLTGLLPKKGTSPPHPTGLPSHFCWKWAPSCSERAPGCTSPSSAQTTELHKGLEQKFQHQNQNLPLRPAAVTTPSCRDIHERRALISSRTPISSDSSRSLHFPSQKIRKRSEKQTQSSAFP